MARFEHGNRAAVGNRGGGRPPKLLRDLTTADAPRIWRELKCIALDPEHPQHGRCGFHALKTLALLAFPRPQTVLLEAAAESFSIMKLADLAAHRLDEKMRDIQQHGVCDACAGSGIGRGGFGVRALPDANGNGNPQG